MLEHHPGALGVLAESEAGDPVVVEAAGCTPAPAPRSAQSPAVHWSQVAAVAAPGWVVALDAAAATCAGAVLAAAPEAERHVVCPAHSSAR